METTKAKLSKACKKTKTGVVNASLFVAEKTKKAFVYTKEHIQTSVEQPKIQMASNDFQFTYYICTYQIKC